MTKSGTEQMYEERLEELYKLEFFGMKLGLQNITDLLNFLGRPDRRIRTVHIAGTNGKGSVASMIAAICTAAGMKTGLYTSPHLIDFRERIRIDGVPINKNSVAEFLEKIWPLTAELRATFFEVTTAMAFDYFAKSGVDIAIIETGLGGRLDATNVLEQPLATVVTSIGLDHMEQLGNSLEEIAEEKAGIFKPGSPAIVNVGPNLHYIFERHANAVGAPLFFVNPSEHIALQSSLPGEHQKSNLATVLLAIQHASLDIPEHFIIEGIRDVARLSGLRARMERIVWQGMDVVLDVGHNPAAIAAQAEYFHSQKIRPIVVLGLMKDKDSEAVLKIVRSFAQKLVTVEAPTVRSRPSGLLYQEALSLGIPVEEGGGVTEGMLKALDAARESSGETPILLTGSHYVVGEFLKNPTNSLPNLTDSLPNLTDSLPNLTEREPVLTHAARTETL